MKVGKLTSAELDAAIYRDRPVPSMEIPQPTEPFHIGASFKKPAPQRSMWEDEIESPWLIRLYGYAFLGAVALCFVVGWWKS